MESKVTNGAVVRPARVLIAADKFKKPPAWASHDGRFAHGAITPQNDQSRALDARHRPCGATGHHLYVLVVAGCCPTVASASR